MRLSRIALAPAATLLMLAAATGCQAQDRAGGTAGDPRVTLDFAQPNDQPDEALRLWALEVDRESKGTVKIHFDNNYANNDAVGAGYEKKTVADVASGKVDAGWVGARAFDQLGVSSFVPLLAPMLIDSQSLQGKVFEAGIPDQMIGGIAKLGIHGVGTLPGPMRVVLSTGSPLISPEAFRGRVVGSADSALARRTYAALGATMTPEPSSADISDLDALEAHMSYVEGAHFEESGGKSVVGNLDLWPRILVLFVGDHAWGKLSPHQQQVLTHAAHTVLPSAVRAARDSDTHSATLECAAGLEMPQATSAQLAAFRSAFRPVYDEISTVARKRDWLDQIEKIKSRLGQGPDAATCHRSTTPSASSALLPDGTYTSNRDGKVGCVNFQPTKFKMIIDHGIVRTYHRDPTTHGRFELGAKGTLTVFKDTLEITDAGGSTSVNFTLQDKTLTITNVRHTDCVAVAVMSGGPWTLQTSR